MGEIPTARAAIQMRLVLQIGLRGNDSLTFILGITDRQAVKLQVRPRGTGAEKRRANYTPRRLLIRP